MSYYIRTLKYMLSIIVMLYAAQTTAATLTYSGDQLISVNGVNVLGGVWDVTFHGDAFDNVDAVYDISQPFFTSAESEALTIALAADMSALAGGVLDPEDVNGCSNFNVECAIVTPYTFITFTDDLTTDLRVKGWSVEVTPSNIITGGTTETTAKRDIEFTHISYAVWEVSAVPVPAAAWLFGSGLIGLIGVARRKKA